MTENKAFECPDCNFELRYRQSSFEQYDPSNYVCDKCGRVYSQLYISAFTAGAASKEAENKQLRELCDRIVPIIEAEGCFCVKSFSDKWLADYRKLTRGGE